MTALRQEMPVPKRETPIAVKPPCSALCPDDVINRCFFLNNTSSCYGGRAAKNPNTWDLSDSMGKPSGHASPTTVVVVVTIFVSDVSSREHLALANTQSDIDRAVLCASPAMDAHWYRSASRMGRSGSLACDVLHNHFHSMHYEPGPLRSRTPPAYSDCL